MGVKMQEDRYGLEIPPADVNEFERVVRAFFFLYASDRFGSPFATPQAYRIHDWENRSLIDDPAQNAEIFFAHVFQIFRLSVTCCQQTPVLDGKWSFGRLKHSVYR